MAVAGVGVEISGGGLPFLFLIEGRRMGANIGIKTVVDLVIEGQPMLHHRAMFCGSRETDFDFLIRVSGKLVSKPVPQYDTLRAKAKYVIISTLVGMKRLARGTISDVSSLEHITPAKKTLHDGVTFLRFNVRSKMEKRRR